MTIPNRAAALGRALFDPRSIALVGASDDAARTTGRPLKFLRDGGYPGRIYPINNRRSTVQGNPAWPSLDALPEVPDHVFILAGADTAVEMIETCARLGVSVATVLASGFSEIGPLGRERERRLREAIGGSELRVLGPNSIGLVSVRNRVTLTANAVFAEGELPVGGTFVASQSGSMIGSLLSRGKARGVGFSGLVSTGAEVDLSIGELCMATLDDDDVTDYALFLENLRHSDQMRMFALAARDRGKPVVVYKLGRSAAAAELAASHTGALAGEDKVASAFFGDLAMTRVETLEALLEAASMSARIQPRRAGAKKPRVGVLTTTGGGAAMVVDQLGIRGINVQQPSGAVFARLAERGIAAAEARIVDVTLAGTNHAMMKASLQILIDSGEFDALIAVVGSSARFNPELALGAVIEVERTHLEKTGSRPPLGVFVVPDAPEAMHQLSVHGLAAFRSPESCADAVVASLNRRMVDRELLPPHPLGFSWRLSESDSYDFLGAVGVRAAAHRVVRSKADIASSVVGLRMPVVVKVHSAQLGHKSDVGGVVVGIRTLEEANAAFDAIAARVARHGLTPGTYDFLIQEMVTDAVGEALVGYRVDDSVGPIVVLAVGGSNTELVASRTLRPAPVDLATAQDMISELPQIAALRGYRGQEAGDLDALADGVVAMSRIGLHRESGVAADVEVNPFMIRPHGQGVVAVDAVVTVVR